MIRAMVVDDEKLVRKGFMSMLNWQAYGIQFAAEAADGLKALEVLEREQVDLIFVDLTMPGMDGFELMEALGRKYPRVWIVVLTCHHEFNYIQEAMRLGAIDYIVKTLLEEESDDQVIQRIVERIHREERLRAAPFRSSESNAQDAPTLQAEWNNRCESWLELKWALDWQEWERFTREIERLDPDPHWIKTFAARMIQECALYLVLGEETVNGLQAAEHHHRLEEWKTWFRNVSILLQKKMEQQSVTKEISQSLLKAIRFSKTHLELNLTQEEVAHHVGMSRGYFSKCFKKMTGQTYVDFLKDCRIEQARDYLETTDMTVGDIAAKVGFEDDRYFSKQFRERTGLPPSQYRSGYQQSQPSGYVHHTGQEQKNLL